MAKILGVRLDTLPKEDILATIEHWFSTSKTHTLYTPNPEMLVDASQKSSFQDILNRSDLNIPDGIGIPIMTGGRLRRIPGIDLMQQICARAEAQEKSIYLLGGEQGIAERAAATLHKQFPQLHILGTSAGPQIEKTPVCHIITESHSLNEAVIEEITRLHPSIVFVAFGHEKQEWWIDVHKSFFPDVRIMMGVGGSFDFLAGTIARAPKVFRVIGIEWVWRLIQEPQRIGRIIKATIHFPLLALREIYKKESYD